MFAHLEISDGSFQLPLSREEMIWSSCCFQQGECKYQQERKEEKRKFLNGKQGVGEREHGGGGGGQCPKQYIHM
jgi:hypothetical protein